VAAQAAPAVKTVTIDTVKLRGSARDPAADVTFANAVFRAANVQFKLVKNETAAAAESDTWLGKDTDLTYGLCGSASGEETDCWTGATARFKLSSRLRAFYPATVSPDARAYSRPPYCARGTAAPLNGMVGVSNSGKSRSLAHELGHILLNSGDHPADTGNIMHETNTSTGEALTPAQQATVYSNA
jgi:hypothetical protein